METGNELRVGAWLVDGDGRLWRVVRVGAASVTLARRGTEIECPLENGLPAGDFTPVEAPDSPWAELGLEAIGRMPRAGDLVAFRAERKLLRVAAVGPETVALEVVRAAPGDEPEIGTRVETTLRDYLEAWGEGAFSAPGEGAETSSSAAPPGA